MGTVACSRAVTAVSGKGSPQRKTSFLEKLVKIFLSFFLYFNYIRRRVLAETIVVII